MKLTVTVLSGVSDDGVITITSERSFDESHPDVQALSARVLKREIDTMEAHARQRLIDMGWTPPHLPKKE